jgi:hypothetical protein
MLISYCKIEVEVKSEPSFTYTVTSALASAFPQ